MSRREITEADSHRFTAGACRFAADAWRESGSEPQRAFAATLDTWAANAERRAQAAERDIQPDLFGADL